jgi:hypothetical protein
MSSLFILRKDDIPGLTFLPFQAGPGLPEEALHGMGVRWRRPGGWGTVDNIHCSGRYTIYLSHIPMPVDNRISTGA